MDLLDRLFAARYDPVMARAERAGLAQLRHDLLGGLRGDVVEIGAGTGGNLPHYGPEVSRLTLCEPTAAMLERLQRAVAGNTTPIEVVAAPGEALPLADRSVDVVVSTLVLCTVGDLTRTVAELTRVLRPGGRLALLEHVHAEGPRATAQRLLEPAWRVAARGCHLTRDPRSALAAAGYDISEVRDVRLPMPGPVRAGQVGVAHLPG